MPKITRRRFVATTGAAVVGLTALESRGVSEASAPAVQQARIGGTLTAIGSPHTIDVLTKATGSEEVKFLGDGSLQARATFLRDGPATLADFFQGDPVVVELRATGRPLRGTHMEILYRLVEGQVTARTADHLATTGGTVRLDAKTTVHVFGNALLTLSLADLAAGDNVAIDARSDPVSGEPIARRIARKATI